MRSSFADVLVICACIAVAILLLAFLHRVWNPRSRSGHNDVIGTNVGVIGTTYAVLIAFMLSNVWVDFRGAETNAEQESNCLVNFFRLAKSLPDPQRTRIRQLARSYASDVVNVEWQQMGNNQNMDRGITQPFWDALTEIQPSNSSERVGLGQAFDELREMTEHRRIRELQSRSHLPPLLWAVLIVGALVTVISSCLFGVENFKLHMVQVSFLSFLLALVLVAIGDIDSPFSGPIRVDPDGFVYAVQTMDRLDGN
jgi:hypothetical protein